jgi:phosphopantetheinyl transferase
MVTPDVLRIELPTEFQHVVAGRMEVDLQASADAFLSRDELAEWTGIGHPARRAEWLAARICLKSLVRERCGIADPRELSVVKEARGRPRLCAACGTTEGDCSLAHAGPWVVTAWTPRCDARLGIDIERIAPRLERVAGAFVSPRDSAAVSRERLHQLAVWWCLKEASAKACGLGLGAGLSEIVCTETTGGRHRIQSDRGPAFDGWHTEFEDFVVAVCLVANGAPSD